MTGSYCPHCRQRITLVHRVRSLSPSHSPRQIRDILVKEGWFVKYRSDPLVTVHVIINRTRERDAQRFEKEKAK